MLWEGETESMVRAMLLIPSCSVKGKCNPGLAAYLTAVSDTLQKNSISRSNFPPCTGEPLNGEVLVEIACIPVKSSYASTIVVHPLTVF